MSDRPTQFTTVEQVLEPKVTREMNMVLTREFQLDEVWRALQQMHPMKSPGPNSMPPVFYQKFWNIIGPNTTEYVLNILNSGNMLV